MLVEHLGGPGLGDEAHEALFGGGGVGAWGEAEALRDAEVVRIDRDGLAPQGGEVDDGRGDLVADARSLNVAMTAGVALWEALKQTDRLPSRG